MLLAIKVERTLSKDEILETYLNTVYFGHGAYGIEAAAQTYFGVRGPAPDDPPVGHARRDPHRAGGV